LPAGGEIVLFDRSWYNRAGVEHVMGFCSDDEYEEFFRTVPEFERMLVRSGIILIKYWFSITDEEQHARFMMRIKDPLKQWKISPIDEIAQKKWSAYSKARDKMLSLTSHDCAPWTVVRANNKKIAHLNLIRDLLQRVSYPKKNHRILKQDPDIVLKWDSPSDQLPVLEK
jgi:polyphosphate kinase 2 (PPK2 family)